MQGARPRQLGLEGGLQGARQHGDAVAVAFAAAHEELAAPRLEVADAQAQAFHEAQARAVEQRRDESRLALEAAEQPPHLLARENDRQPPWAVRAHEVELADLVPQHVAVEEEQRAERLRLGRGADVLVHGEVSEEGVDLPFAHLRRVPEGMEADVAPRPAAVRLLGAAAVVAGAQGELHLGDERGHMPQCDRGATEFNG